MKLALPTNYKQYVCRTCGSSDVGWDAWSEWDSATNQEVLRTGFDDAHCFQCEGETRTEEVEITDASEIAYIDEQRAKLRAEHHAVAMLEAMKEFVAGVDAGKIRSKRTYAKFKDIIANTEV